MESPTFLSSAKPIRRVVFKFGTGVLTTCRDRVEPDSVQFARIAASLAEMKRLGYECVVVSSGAVAAGLRRMGLTERPRDMASLQACAAVGQCQLMHLYESLFRLHEITVAQLLVTHSDLETPSRAGKFQSTLFRLLENPAVIPIINENDSVAVEELRYGDNDALSARVAVLCGADLLVLLTGVDGLLDLSDPARPRVISEVENLDDVVHFAGQEKGDLSVGGMVSKLQAVRRCVEAGIPAMIANGRNPEQFPQLAEGEGLRTRFHPVRQVTASGVNVEVPSS
jgi:glutamate 5-kinase